MNPSFWMSLPAVWKIPSLGAVAANPPWAIRKFKELVYHSWNLHSHFYGISWVSACEMSNWMKKLQETAAHPAKAPTTNCFQGCSGSFASEKTWKD
jgi:hypothetical protein